jgi:hypothetical protein
VAEQREALYRSQLEQNLATASADVAATRPAAPAAGAAGVDPLATLLVGLAGGLVIGAAAIIGWTARSRRRLPRAAAGT